MPWNYCSEVDHFCKHKEVYCTLKKINVQCGRENFVYRNSISYNQHKNANKKLKVFSSGSTAAERQLKVKFLKETDKNMQNSSHLVELFVYGGKSKFFNNLLKK